ncbi:MAG: multiheme c-type cytochrome [bacterium]|nr:multiheme c-type cytochrome [bacterium]
MRGLLFLLALLFWTPAEGLEPLSSEEQAAFLLSVHEFLECSDCHSPDQPDRIPKIQVPILCGDCHPDPYSDYIRSVHWKKGNPQAICIDCHGTHNITPVQNPNSKAYRSLVCGTCHMGPKENFDAGPHKAGMEKIGALACSSCHSNHNVQPPTIALMEDQCAACHATNTPAFAMGQRVKSRFTALRDTLFLAEAEIAHATTLGLNTRRAESSLQNAHAGLAQTRLIWHILNEDAVHTTAKQAAQSANSARALVAELLNDQRLRRIGLTIAWAVILINVVLLYLKHRRLESEED